MHRVGAALYDGRVVGDLASENASRRSPEAIAIGKTLRNTLRASSLLSS